MLRTKNLKRVSGWILKLESVFIEASINFIFNLFLKKRLNILKTITTYKESTDLMFETFEQVFMPWHNPFNFLGFSHSIDHEKESKGKNNKNNKMSVQIADIQIQYCRARFPDSISFNNMPLFRYLPRTASLYLWMQSCTTRWGDLLFLLYCTYRVEKGKKRIPQLWEMADWSAPG